MMFITESWLGAQERRLKYHIQYLNFNIPFQSIHFRRKFLIREKSITEEQFDQSVLTAAEYG